MTGGGARPVQYGSARSPKAGLHDEVRGAGRMRRSGAIRDQVADHRRSLGPTVAPTDPARACLSGWAGRHIRSPCWRSFARLSLYSEAEPSARRASTLRRRLVVSHHHSLLHGFCGQTMARPTGSSHLPGLPPQAHHQLPLHAPPPRPKAHFTHDLSASVTQFRLLQTTSCPLKTKRRCIKSFWLSPARYSGV